MAWLKRRGRMFYVAFPVKGRRHPKLISTGTSNEREADAFLDEWEREHVAGEDVQRPEAAPTVESWGREWNAARKVRDVLDWIHELGHLENHVFPELGPLRLTEVTKARMLTWIADLAKKRGRYGERIAPATVRKVSATCRALFREAVKRDLVVTNPCVWTRSDLPRKVTVSRTRDGGLSAEQVGLLIGDPRLPEDRRVLYALELLTGMRTGEAAARRWCDWQPVFLGELGRLVVATSYNTRHAIVKTTKTDVEKWAPVHPVLAEMLRQWKAAGWARAFGRVPGPDDLIVPAEKGGHRNNGTSHRLWWADLEALGIPRRRHYETRATFRSLALAGGAVEKDLDRITHPSPKAASDLYDRPALLWPRLCAAVRCVAVEPRGAGPGGRRANVEGVRGTGTPDEPGDGESPKTPVAARALVGSGLTAEQGNRTPQQRLSAPSTGFEDRARHQPRTLCRARVYVPGAAASSGPAGPVSHAPRRIGSR